MRSVRRLVCRLFDVTDTYVYNPPLGDGAYNVLPSPFSVRTFYLPIRLKNQSFQVFIFKKILKICCNDSNPKHLRMFNYVCMSFNIYDNIAIYTCRINAIA